MNDFKIKEIHELLCDSVSYYKAHVDEMDIDKAGELADIIKDFSEAEKNSYEACYYKTVIDAMESGEDDRYGYTPEHMSNRVNARMPEYGMKYGYDPYGRKPMVDQEPYVEDYINRKRYGYTDPENFETMVEDAKAMWTKADPVRRASMKKELTAFINGLE